MNGGGPVLANACTMLPAMTTMKTTAASVPRKPSDRGRSSMSSFLVSTSRSPIVATLTQ